MNKKILGLLLLFLIWTLLLPIPQVVVAAPLRLTWEYKEDVTKITGFRIYSGPKSFPDAKQPTTGAAPYERMDELTDPALRSWNFTVAFPGSRFIRMTTFKRQADGKIIESVFSNEVGITTTPNPPENLVIGE